MKLALNDDELALCVSCGLCLPHCPTYRVTGEESASPRGRIAAMRSIQAGAPAGADFERFMDLCVQCRGCETACPSAVPFGRLMEGARHSLTENTRYQPRWRRLGYRLLGHHRLVLFGGRVVTLAQRLGLVPKRAGLPPLPLRRPTVDTHGTDAWVFLGCVMDAFQRPVHAAVQRVMEATGCRTRPSPGAAGCCGALAAHAGLVEIATRQASRLIASMPGHSPVVVDSAGCGAYMKEYGRVLGAEGAAFASRVQDASEWLAGRDLPPMEPLPLRVALQDPCHLRHVQKAHQAVRVVLAPAVAALVELTDDGLCCGAGGAYAVWHPEMANAIRARKLDAIAASGATVVASANPGCAMHLAGAGLDVRHPLELIDEAITRAREARRG